MTDDSATLESSEDVLQKDAQGFPCDADGKAWRSASQVKEHMECPYRLKLSRIDKAWKRPAAWFPQGTGVHAAAEAYERSGRTLTPEAATDVFRTSYVEECNKLQETTPNLDFWFASGPYRAKEDIPRRFGIGEQQVTKYIQWYAKHPEEKPWTTPAGELAVELPFETKFGDVPVRGFIDIVLTDLRPRDNKTGNRAGDVFQLGTYAGALENIYGIKPSKGDFWMGKTGKATIPADLTGYSQEYLADVYGQADEAIRSGSFDPDPEPDKCRFCPVALSCEFRA